MRGIIFASALIAFGITAGLSGVSAGESLIDLGGIPQRHTAPEFSFDRFFDTRKLGQIEFAPDNQSIYFLRDDGHATNVFAIELATRNMRQVTHYAESVSEFFIDPGGRYVITVQDIKGNEAFDLYRYDLASGAVRRLTVTDESDRCTVCGLSPDGAFVYYAQTRNSRGASDLWRGEVVTGSKARLLRGEGRVFECEAVSPKGRYLLFGELIGHSERHLALLDLTTGRARYIMRVPGGNNIDGDFTADGVYFRSAWGSDRFRIWYYRFGSRTPKPLKLPFDNDVDLLSLYTGGRVAVVTYRDALTGRTVVFIDGLEAPQVFGLPPEDIVDAAFSRNDPDFGIVSVGNATTPLRYYRVGRDATELIYDSNESGIENGLFAEARSLRVPSFDGLEIPVHLFIPNGTSAANPRPAIFVIHGGPESHLDPLYMAKLQFLANRGFIVVLPNVRGSTGFGMRYALLGNGDWGGAHIRDTVEVARFVHSLDFVDGDNLFIAGASFGGFSVMSLITQYPKTFRAAASFFGFTELATFVDSWPPYLQRRLFADLGFDPRIDYLRNRARSPLYHVDRIRIPLQVHQGANDRRVPRAQSDRLVERMRELGRKVEYFVYPDEGHGFTRFENERASFERMVAFFRQHMQRHNENVEPGVTWYPGANDVL